MKYIPPVGSTDTNASYVNANPALGVRGSKVPAEAIEPTMREIVNTITAAGLTASEGDLTQLKQAIINLIINVADINATPNTIVKRTANATIATANPIIPTDATNKTYVDNIVTLLQNAINSIAGEGQALDAADLGATPSQSDLTLYAFSEVFGEGGTFTWNSTTPGQSTYVINDVTHPADEIFNGTWVKNKNANNPVVWKLANTPNTIPIVFEWINIGETAIAQFSNNYEGVIKGVADDDTPKTFGAVCAQIDGTGRVNGLTAQGDGSQIVTNAGVQSMGGSQSELTTTNKMIITAINELQSGKIDKSFDIFSLQYVEELPADPDPNTLYFIK
jgi:hypothetical protein